MFMGGITGILIICLHTCFVIDIWFSLSHSLLLFLSLSFLSYVFVIDSSWGLYIEQANKGKASHTYRNIMDLTFRRKCLAALIFIVLSAEFCNHFLLSRPKVFSRYLQRKTSNSMNFIVFSEDYYPYPGLRHLRTNFKCQLAIAQLLNKTMVFPKLVGIPELHSASLLYVKQSKFKMVPTESIINVKLLSLYFDAVLMDDVILNQNNSVIYQFRDLAVVRKYRYCCWQELCLYDPPPSSPKYSMKNVEDNFHRYQQPVYLVNLTLR